MDIIVDEDLLSRAMAAWFKRAMGPGEVYQQPGYFSSYACRDSAGKTYVVLANNYDVLAVYRLRNQGTLRRLRRWPKAVEAVAHADGRDKVQKGHD